VRFRIFHAKDAKDAKGGKEILFLKNLCDPCDRGVRLWIVHAKSAKGGMGISKFGFRNSKIISCGDAGRILLNYLSAPWRPWREVCDSSYERRGFVHLRSGKRAKSASVEQSV